MPDGPTLTPGNALDTPPCELARHRGPHTLPVHVPRAEDGSPWRQQGDPWGRGWGWGSGSQGVGFLLR